MKLLQVEKKKYRWCFIWQKNVIYKLDFWKSLLNFNNRVASRKSFGCQREKQSNCNIWIVKNEIDLLVVS